MNPSGRIERTLAIFDSPEEAEAATRRLYRTMSPNERVSLTVELQRSYYQRRDPAARGERAIHHELPAADFREFLRCLIAREVRFLVVGGHAVSFHGYPRFTHDVDVVVVPDETNAEALLAALSDFGFGSVALQVSDFLKPITVVLGHPPAQVDIMTFIKGVDLADAWARREVGELDGVEVAFISRQDLIANKRAVGRPEDLADIARISDRPS